MQKVKIGHIRPLFLYDMDIGRSIIVAGRENTVVSVLMAKDKLYFTGVVA